MFSKQPVCKGWSNYRGKLLNTNMFEISRFKIARVLINPYESRLSLRINQLFLPFTNHAFCRSSVHHSTNALKTFWDLIWIRQAYHNIPSGNIPSSLSKRHQKSVSSVNPGKYCVNMSILQTCLNMSSLYQRTLPFSYHLSTLV